MISIVILTYNEVKNIERCIRSVSWSNDILIVDSGSSDETCSVAEKLGVRVIHRQFDHFAGQRNFAIDHGNLRHDWILHLDADEVVSEELKIEMFRILSTDNPKFGYRVPSKLMFMGHWLKYSGMYPSYQVRFGLKSQLRFHMVGHGQRELLLPDNLGVMSGDIIHFNFSKGISEWIIKHSKYAKDEARNIQLKSKTVHWKNFLSTSDPVERRRMLKALSSYMPMRPLFRFIYIFFIRKGFLDGWTGFQYAILIGFYQWLIDLNRIELDQDD